MHLTSIIVHLPAYIGPGAGFAFAGSLLSVVVSVLAGFASLALWPFRAARRMLRRRRNSVHAKARRVIFLGLDGLDPKLTAQYMAEGLLPNLAKLRESGSYSLLRTTYPALSPVAWSTFATGVSPAKHNIFDFLNRSLKTYAPELAPSLVRPPRNRWSKPFAESRRKSQTFWKILGDHAIQSTILRVPITFPPEEFDGRMLSAMCTPDLKGTQSSFSYFEPGAHGSERIGGSQYPLFADGDAYRGVLEGPAGARGLPFRLDPLLGTLEIARQRLELKQGIYSDWVRLPFRVGWATIAGIARFLLQGRTLYVTPVQLDPEAPALPISHPPFFAKYLSKLLGPFATLGMAEDTWALNEGAISPEDFLQQAYLTLAEREAMFDHALEHTAEGVIACVFDTSDRVQHMFFRGLDDAAGSPVLRDLYQRMDRIVGKALPYATPDSVLIVLSDHGFCHFRRAVNLNRWLIENGYMHLLPDGAIDWARTRAYSIGLSGLYLNRQGREAQGIVTEPIPLARELAARLTGLPDPDRNTIAIREAKLSRDVYRGPYLDAAPDLLIGFADGYRAAWDAATGKPGRSVFEDNDKHWSGDHCVDPALVPGVLFSTRKFEAKDPGIEDMAATALDLFGIPRPAWMEGKSLFA